MMRLAKWCAAGSLIMCAASWTMAQQADPARPVSGDRSVIRMSIDLVQIDAIVTDERGRHIRDLAPEDFEILQDGKPQTITTFAYVASGGPVVPETAPRSAVPPRATSPMAVSPSLTAAQVQRTIAVVVDDLNMSFESVRRVRGALKRFIDEQLKPGDLVAILRTGAGMGALQQFTTDRRLLHAAADGVRWNMQARVAPFEAATGIDTRLEPIEKELATAATLGAIQYVIRGVAPLPGRKSVLVLSDGFRLTDADRTYGRILDMMRSLLDASNRSGVVLYGIDLRGLVATSPTAADGSPASPGDLVQARVGELADTQAGLGALAHDTGGLFIKNANDIGGALRRVVDDQQGYYLLGYVPDRSTFSTRGERFHSLAVRVKRDGFRVRSRRGFLEPPATTPTPESQANRMVAAVTSPFAGGDIRLRLTSFFGQAQASGPIALSMMHVDARDLTFSEQADGTRVAAIELLAITFGENGQVADRLSRRYAVTLSPERYARALQSGFVYNMRVPLKQPGPYQLRIALRDVSSDRIGSAAQFIDVPDVKRGRLTLSGLLIQGGNTAHPTDGAPDDVHPDTTVAVRRFRRGTSAHYFTQVYNARRGAGGRQQLESEVRLFREGVLVFSSGPQSISQSVGGHEVTAGGTLQLGTNLAAGSYLLEIAVRDRAARNSPRATQTIDFELID